jgi:hypothetical protein
MADIDKQGEELPFSPISPINPDDIMMDAWIVDDPVSGNKAIVTEIDLEEAGDDVDLALQQIREQIALEKGWGDGA